MVTTGFSLPVVAEYTNSGENVTYQNGMSLGRGVSLSLEVETADDNTFYADNTLAESETGMFTSGTATITVDGLTNDAAKLVLGLLDPETFSYGDSKQASLQGYGSVLNPPFVGFGCVWRTQMNGVVQYWPLILPKVRFGLPSQDMATQEDQIDWQSQELSATVYRDDTAAANWKLIGAEAQTTEAAAYEIVAAYLGGLGE